ncbi:MAG: antibiotic biosynthesis monooxygenase [Lysobacterales bacterium]
MHCIVWEFEVAPEHTGAFLAAYGAEGVWCDLFRRDPTWLGTALLRDVARPQVFVTVDRWRSAADYAAFRAREAAAYARLDADCEGWTRRETFLCAGDAA